MRPRRIPAPTTVKTHSEVRHGVYLGLTWLLLALPMAAAGQRVDPTPARAVTSDDEITKAVEVTRTHPSDTAWSHLGDVFMQKARETFDLSYYARAEAAYRKAIDLNATQADALAGMAWVESARHEFEQSIDWANRALAVQPNRPDAYGLLGDAAVEMGDYDKAFEHYQKMLDIRPDISSYSRAAHLLFLTGDVKKATWLMMKAIAAGAPYAENTAWCRAQLALMQFAEGAYLPASQVLADALTKAPGNYHVLAALGKVKAALKDYPAAIDYYKQAEAVVPQHEVVVALGDIYALQGNQRDADAQYALVEVIRKLNRANGVIGDLQWVQFSTDHDRNLPQALRMAESEYKTRPNVYAADILAWCYFKNSMIPDARRYIDKALSRKTPEAMFLYHKGVIYAASRETATARTALYQALSLNPNFHPIESAAAMKRINELGSVPMEAATSDRSPHH